MINKSNQFSKDLFEKKESGQFAMETRHLTSDIIDIPIYHYHNFYEILYYYEGIRGCTVNNASSILNKNTIAFISPYKLHKTYIINQKGSKRILINFSYDFIKELNDKYNHILLECFSSPKSIITFSDDTADTICGLFQNMLFEYNQTTDDFSQPYIQTLLVQLLLIASRTQKNSDLKIPNISASPYYSVIMNIAEYIKNNFTHQISLDSLSKQFCISKNTISREFKHIMGVSFVEHINNLRINNAQKLILNSDQSITSIAYECGFETLVHFERVFKRQMQISPREYARKNRIKL
ncbi:MAG: AraC family transcriptional regulator [Clostridia bacterium]|nr:AraC family transcriptional regulator [Clostridia bacterium]